MANVDWERIGIPRGYGYKQLLYNPPTQTLVIELHSFGEEFQPPRLYKRHKADAVYEQICTPEHDISYQSPVTALTQPLLYFNSFRWAGGGGDWDAVCRLDLRSPDPERLIDSANISLPSPFSDCWITDLVSTSEDGSQLYLRISIREETGTKFYLARVDVSTKAVELITCLQGVCF